jgi:predicted O-linked N-acetylglucosamine transferase (SPINDLY family)
LLALLMIVVGQWLAPFLRAVPHARDGGAGGVPGHEAFHSRANDRYTGEDDFLREPGARQWIEPMMPTQIEQEIQAALLHHQAGRLAEAEALYRRVLAEVPEHVGALQLLGIVSLQAGNTAGAIELIGRAATLEPQNAAAHSNLAEAYLRAGQFTGAIASARRALELQSDLVVAQINLGAALALSGQHSEAIAAYQRALAVVPDHPQLHSNLGIALQAAGRLDEAVTALRRAVALRPDQAELHVNLGNALKDQGRLDEAIDAYRRAIALRPDDAVAHSNLGVALYEAQRYDEATAAYRDALQRKPDDAETHANLGVALQATGQLDEAIAACRSAVAIEGDSALVQSNLALALRSAGRADEAIAALQHAIALDPRLAAAYSNLGTVLDDAGRLDEALAALGRAIELRPDDADARNNLGNVLKHQGRLDEAIGAFRQAVAVKPGLAKIASNLLYSLHSHPGYDAQALLSEHRAWARRYAAPLAAEIRPHANDRDPARRLKVGYVSPDLRAHAVGKLVWPLLVHRDRSRFEVVAYSDVRVGDAVTTAIRGQTDHWRDIAGQSDAQVAERIRGDRIDILVDLALHTAGNRMLVFARKPAPVQVTTLGLPATTGLDTIDYRLTDPYLDPPGQTDADYTERSVRLPHCFWVFQPPDAAETYPVTPLPALSNGFVTFGCLNQFAKVTRPALELWVKILRAVPRSQLVLQSPPGRHLEAVRELFAQGGIAADRLSFVPRAARREYHRRLDALDLALDPFPYNGHTSTLDALWMGVPVVTLAGCTAVGRGGVSILSNVNLHNLIARTTWQYVDISVALAGDLERLADLRTGLRGRLLASPLADTEGYTAAVEAALLAMWQTWCRPAASDK